MEIKNNRHACYKLEYHLIVVTKYRKKLINNTLKIDLINETKILFEEKWHCEIININTDQDHIHILFESYPTLNLSTFINSYKSASSRKMRTVFKSMLCRFYWKPYFWSRSYFICTVSEKSLQYVQQYIQDQVIK